ncbi:hypothetical protein [Massilia cavernae]|uniref:Phosphate starvation-inducible protein PsiF n=1 Tax=Massilia cavernae TaxID=2320864 RepID=A0A418XGJ4_9BURK|nr:hypothetical protein [Massilia cavernae]RJG11565.1 hypothetical protein D3872_19000 [Massilia cavernae]
MSKLLLAVAGLLLSGAAMASHHTPEERAAACEAKAMDKNGKMLAGAAKKSFMKKCDADMMSGMAKTCADKAVGKSGKPLAGAAKTSFMKKCEAEAPKA